MLTPHPKRISNVAMGYIFEDLVRRFNEQANEEAGDHFTPREVVKSMVKLLFTVKSTSTPRARLSKSMTQPVNRRDPFRVRKRH